MVFLIKILITQFVKHQDIKKKIGRELRGLGLSPGRNKDFSFYFLYATGIGVFAKGAGGAAAPPPVWKNSGKTPKNSGNEETISDGIETLESKKKILYHF